MSDYSTSPQEVLLANQQKGYVGLHIEQGVPLLDRDLNLLHDLISATIRSLIANYVGNGVAAGTDGFAIQPLVSPANTQNFLIAVSTYCSKKRCGTCIAWRRLLDSNSQAISFSRVRRSLRHWPALPREPASY